MAVADKRLRWQRNWPHTDAKPCNLCGVTKTLDAFSPQRLGFLGRAARCRPCQNSYQNALNNQPARREQRRVYYQRYNSQPSRMRANRLAWVRRKFGENGVAIELRREAGEPCDACGGITDVMHLDHCHVTGKARGLLCRECNLTLGHAEDDPKTLRALADYLERARGVADVVHQ